MGFVSSKKIYTTLLFRVFEVLGGGCVGFVATGRSDFSSEHEMKQ